MDEHKRVKAAIAESGQTDRPVFAPHLEYRSLGDGQILLVSEAFNTLLHGQVYEKILPLLDGSNQQQDIIDTLSGVYPEASVRHALTTMIAKGYVVSGAHDMEQGKAAFWSSIGASPCRAERLLSAARIVVRGDDGRLAACLQAMGIASDSAHPALSVYVGSDYLGKAYEAINQQHLESGSPWILVRPKGMQPLFGPVFRPAENGPCWACLSYRLRNNQEVHSFLRNHCGEEAAFHPGVAEPLLLDIVNGVVATEIAKWLVLGPAAPLQNQAITLDIAEMKSAYHAVMRRPQCRVCGDEAHYRTDRPAVPIRLQSNPIRLRNSGGMHAAPPAETLDRYQHLVSPVSGIVTWVKRKSSETDPWLHVHWAGSNLALRVKNLSSLRRSLRSKSAGKGSTSEQSKVSALCEAIERYCGAFHGDEIRCQGRFADFPGIRGGQAIHPNDVQLFSDRQLDHAEDINTRGHPYNVIPARFNPDSMLDWSPVWSLTHERECYLPTSMLYGMTPEQRGASGLWADSNGCAAGNTLEEAILQGFFELVERDAFAIWWYNRLQRPGVDLDSFGDPYLASAPDHYRPHHRDIWALDITSDLGIPAFVALSRRNDVQTEDIIYGAGAHTDPHIAILRAVCELNQCLAWAPHPRDSQTHHGIDDPMCLWWWKNGKVADHPHLAPARGVRPHCGSDYRIPDTADLKQDVERCRELIEAKGMELLVLDQTRPDIGMPVVRVIVPGLRHFWERFAPGRLYDVPVDMGWTEQPAQESALNPVPVIA